MCQPWCILTVCQQAPDIPTPNHTQVSQHTDPIKVLPSRIRDKYNLGSHFYIDLWPMADPFLAVFDPELAAQFTTDYSAQSILVSKTS
jgi:hypothetical protein